jgi:hypothetical protein
LFTGDNGVVLQEPEFVIYGTVDSWLRSEIFELSQPLTQKKR